MTKVIATAQAPEAIGPYIQGARVGGFIFTSGQLPINPATGEIAGSAGGQARQSLENIKAIIEAGGLALEHICKVNIFVKDLNEFAEINQGTPGFLTSTRCSIRRAPAWRLRACLKTSKLKLKR